MSSEELTKTDFRQLAEQSMRNTDDILESELQALLKAGKGDLEKLRPHCTDGESYEQLLAAVEKATAANESAAQLKEHLVKGGKTTLKVSKIAARILLAV